MTTQAISYNISGAVEATGYSRSAIYLALKERRLSKFKQGTRTYILHDELARFIKEESSKMKQHKKRLRN